ncbi:MAG: hypothetical protein AAGF02_13815 [Actinomycetota bacterium]
MAEATTARDDRGGGPISAAVGVTVLLSFLLLTVHLLLGAWASSRAGALAADAARIVAEADDTGAGAARARAMVLALEPDATVGVSFGAGTPAEVVVTVSFPGPTLAGSAAPFATIERTARQPVEVLGS